MALLLLIMFFILAIYIYKKREKPILKIILCFIGYILLSIGIVGFPNIHEKGISIFVGFIYFSSTFSIILSGLLLILYVVFESKIKNTSGIKKRLKYINGYTMSLITIILAFIGFSLNNHAETRQGESLGFIGDMDFSEAKRHKIYNIDEYSKFLADKKSKEDAELAAKEEKDKIKEIEQAKKDSEYTLLSKSPFENDNGENDIVVKFDKNNPFEMSVLKNIQSYQNASFKHNRAAMIFRDYGIDLRDFDKLVLPRCSQRVEELKSGYKRETEAWLPYSHYVNRDVLRKEKEYRDNYNREFSEKMQHETNIMNECFYSLSQKLPNHSPRNSPE
ncbi:hypothetical protein [Yersinia intermedia]|uniref:hypothetical protein n=1 Tax=Yersinia intermedia TaxID=631 RepID=UPI00065CE078|nr:hypothetical protein [Yersinia intermedia]CRY75353.1 Uncharacterised protein [Yersinia intermedia]